MLAPRQHLGSHTLQTPHSGYQWDGYTHGFFEGWYFRITLPRPRATFAFMYSIQDPIGGQPYSGGVAQVLGPGDTYLCRSFPQAQLFWAWSEGLGLGHWRQPSSHQSPGFLLPLTFARQIQEGYQVTATWHQGQLKDPVCGEMVAWQYQVWPIYGWGNPGQVQQSTAGWLSQWPIFEPGWQVLMAHGLATGWILWQGQRYRFHQVPAYSEKNWGRAFPKRWFWLQCNAFDQQPEISLTAAGGHRQILGWTETVGMVGLHYQGQFYEFVPWNAMVSWHVSPWGDWHIKAERSDYVLELHGTTAHPGVGLRAPTEQGVMYCCRHTAQGQVSFSLWRKFTGRLSLILQATSQQAALEIGGSPWCDPWHKPNS